MTNKYDYLIISDALDDSTETMRLIKQIDKEMPSIRRMAVIVQNIISLSKNINTSKSKKLIDELERVLASINYYILSVKKENLKLKKENNILRKG
jgi:hypothetical protein